MDLIEKQLTLAAAQTDTELQRHIIEDALENCVSAFDGFAREICRIHASRSSDPVQCANVSFQNLPRAAKRLISLFGIDITTEISSEDWNDAHIAFMQRHVFVHHGGVIDHRYLEGTGQPKNLLGRRLAVTASNVENLARIILTIARSLLGQLR